MWGDIQLEFDSHKLTLPGYDSLIPNIIYEESQVTRVNN